MFDLNRDQWPNCFSWLFQRWSTLGWRWVDRVWSGSHKSGQIHSWRSGLRGWWNSHCWLQVNLVYFNNCPECSWGKEEYVNAVFHCIDVTCKDNCILTAFNLNLSIVPQGHLPPIQGILAPQCWTCKSIIKYELHVFVPLASQKKSRMLCKVKEYELWEREHPCCYVYVWVLFQERILEPCNMQ